MGTGILTLLGEIKFKENYKEIFQKT